MRTQRGKNRGDQSSYNGLSPMLTTGEACRILCVHSNTLRRWSEQGIVVAYRIGPRSDRRFKREDIVALLNTIKKEKESKFIT